MPSTADQRALEVFRRRFGGEPRALVRAPGRVNLIGEHVDYNEGFVLPAAIDRDAWVAASPSDDGAITLEAVDVSERVRFDGSSAARKLDCDGRPLPAWALYAAGVAHVLASNGHAICGLDAALASDVPIGAGLSSSAAIEVALAATWRALCRLAIEPTDLARLCQQAECEYVGVRCGVMDQFVSVHGKRDGALFLDCRSLEWKTVPLPAETRLVVADSKVRRELASSEFNVRRRECEEAVAALGGALPGIRSLRDVSPDDLERHGHLLSPVLRRRARHVVGEIARVAAVIADVERGDAAALGRAMTDAHQSGRFLYEVSCDELDLLVESAIGLDGCHGARLTGAGFGGCTVSLVDAAAADEFATALARIYHEATGHRADVWICRAADGMSVKLSA